MALQFTNQNTAKATIQDDTQTKYTLTGINGKTNDAEAVMGGLSILLDVVGWGIQDAQRIVTQDIEEIS